MLTNASLSFVLFTTVSYQSRTDSFRFRGLSTSCKNGPNTYGGFSTTRSHCASPLHFSQNVHAARSASVLLARYFAKFVASRPFSLTSVMLSSFQSASEKTRGAAEGGRTAAHDEVTTMRWTAGPCLSAEARMPVVPRTAGSMSSSGSSTLKWKGDAVCAIASMPLTASSNAPSYVMGRGESASVQWDAIHAHGDRWYRLGV